MPPYIFRVKQKEGRSSLSGQGESERKRPVTIYGNKEKDLHEEIVLGFRPKVKTNREGQSRRGDA